MASLYNNLTNFGRTKLRVESVVLYLLAALALLTSLYEAVQAHRRRQGSQQRKRRSMQLLSAAGLCALLAWASGVVSARDNSFSRLLAASSGLQFFSMPFM